MKMIWFMITIYYFTIAVARPVIPDDYYYYGGYYTEPPAVTASTLKMTPPPSTLAFSTVAPTTPNIDWNNFFRRVFELARAKADASRGTTTTVTTPAIETKPAPVTTTTATTTTTTAVRKSTAPTTTAVRKSTAPTTSAVPWARSSSAVTTTTNTASTTTNAAPTTTDAVPPTTTMTAAVSFSRSSNPVSATTTTTTTMSVILSVNETDRTPGASSTNGTEASGADGESKNGGGDELDDDELDNNSSVRLATYAGPTATCLVVLGLFYAVRRIKRRGRRPGRHPTPPPSRECLEMNTLPRTERKRSIEARTLPGRVRRLPATSDSPYMDLTANFGQPLRRHNTLPRSFVHHAHVHVPADGGENTYGGLERVVESEEDLASWGTDWGEDEGDRYLTPVAFPMYEAVD